MARNRSKQLNLYKKAGKKSLKSQIKDCAKRVAELSSTNMIDDDSDSNEESSSYDPTIDYSSSSIEAWDADERCTEEELIYD